MQAFGEVRPRCFRSVPLWRKTFGSTYPKRPTRPSPAAGGSGDAPGSSSEEPRSSKGLSSVPPAAPRRAFFRALLLGDTSPFLPAGVRIRSLPGPFVGGGAQQRPGPHVSEQEQEERGHQDGQHHPLLQPGFKDLKATARSRTSSRPRRTRAIPPEQSSRTSTHLSPRRLTVLPKPVSGVK